MAAPLITAITTVPNRENATNQASFSNDVDTFFSEVNDFQTEANAQAQYLDGVAAGVDAAAAAATEDINAAAAAATTGIDASEAAAAESALEASGYASTAVDARNAAIASAVYKGTWEGKTSAGVIGESYSYQGSYIYRLNVNLANISTSEPSPTNTNWQLINVVPFEAPCKPTFDLDFANQDFTIYDKLGGFVKRPLADIVSQGRTTAGQSTDAIGGVTEFAAGENRFTFDGETGEALGYLSEEGRTNLLTNSEFPNGLSDAPSRSGLLTLSAMNLGNGSVNAIAFGYDGSTASSALKQVGGAGLASSTLYVFSVFVEMEDGQPPILNSATPSDAGNDFALRLNVGLFPDPTTFQIKRSFGNTYKVSCVFTSTSTSSREGVVKYSTNSARTFKVTGYQLEVGSFPTSYIRTLGAPVTRAADALTRTLGQEWNPNEGTLVVDLYNYTIDEIAAGIGVRRILSSPSSNFVFLDAVKTQTLSEYRVFNGAVLTKSANSLKEGRQRVVVSIDKNSVKICVDGGNVSENNALDNTQLLSRTSIAIKDAINGLQMNNTIKSLKYYPRAFDSLTLQRLSRIQ